MADSNPFLRRVDLTGPLQQASLRAVIGARKHGPGSGAVNSAVEWAVGTAVTGDIGAVADAHDDRHCRPGRHSRHRQRHLYRGRGQLALPVVKFAQIARGLGAAGIRKWRYWRLRNFAIEGVTGFTVLPLKVASDVGLVFALVTFPYGDFVILKAWVVGESFTGDPSLMVERLFCGGAQLMGVGRMGEYRGRKFIETKRRALSLLERLCPVGAKARGSHAQVAS